MPCLGNNLLDLQNLSRCQMNVSGLNKMYVTAYEPNFFSNLEFMGNYVSGLNQTYRFIELTYSKSGSKYDDLYNYDTNKYEIALSLELIGVDWEKRNAIDSLIKSNLIIIFENYMGKYFLIGEKNGISSTKFNSTTDVVGGKSAYQFTLNCKSDYLPFGISKELVDEITKVDCSDINDTYALNNNYLWLPYKDCLVGNFSGFTNP